MKARVTGNRKAAADRLAEITGQKAVYTRAPRFAYKIGDIYIERDGEITPMADMDWQPIRELANDGLCEVEGGQEPGQNTDIERTNADKARTDGLTISFPKGDFTEAALVNLEKILAAKAGLIKKALGADRLTVDTGDEKWVAFPWWDTLPTVEEATVYCAFIAAVCKLAQNAKRVTAKEAPAESEKYAFRCFLLRLGFIGAEHKTERKILLSKLSGSAAFVSQDKADAFAAAQKEKRDSAKEAEE